MPKVSTNRPTGCGLADRVGDLDLAPVGQPGGDHVLRHPAHRVRGRAVDLRRVLAGERAAAVPGVAAVRVDDDLAAGQPGVAHRAADLEPAGRVDQQPVAAGVEVEAGQLRVDHVLLDVRLEQRLEVDVGRVLGGDDDGVQPDRLAVLVLDGDLGLAVRPQVGNGAVLADLRSAGGPAGAPARSAAASARGSRRRRSRTSCPGRRRPAWRARRAHPPRGSSARSRRPGRCPATASRSTRSRRRRRRRSPSSRSRSRSRGSSPGRSSGCPRTRRW